MQRERLSLEEFINRLRSQDVSSDDLAFICPVCGTVQSIRSFLQAGVQHDLAERLIGFSCIGRIMDAGPFMGAKGRTKGDGLGCDWTLGGLFSLHELEVETPDGEIHPRFRPATQDEALELEVKLTCSQPHTSEAPAEVERA